MHHNRMERSSRTYHWNLWWHKTLFKKCEIFFTENSLGQYQQNSNPDLLKSNFLPVEKFLYSFFNMRWNLTKRIHSHGCWTQKLYCVSRYAFSAWFWESNYFFLNSLFWFNLCLLVCFQLFCSVPCLLGQKDNEFPLFLKESYKGTVSNINYCTTSSDWLYIFLHRFIKDTEAGYQLVVLDLVCYISVCAAPIVRAMSI